MTRRRLSPRKLLVASVGVATLNYLGAAPTACGGKADEGPTATGGNGGQGGSAGSDGSVGNLMPPPNPTVANLMPPPSPSVMPPPSTTVTNPFPPPARDASVAPPRDAIAPPVDAGAHKDAATD